MWIFVDKVYEKLVSLIVGSYYITFHKNDNATTFSQDIARTSKNISKIELKEWVWIPINYFIDKDAELGKNEEDIEVIPFDKLKGKSLGSLSNILFWNDQQKHVASRIEKMEHTLLTGDYGTG